MTQLEKLAEPTRSLGAAQRDHVVVTTRGARTVARQLAVARVTRRGLEVGTSMREWPTAMRSALTTLGER
jgi:hypothetical protein